MNESAISAVDLSLRAKAIAVLIVFIACWHGTVAAASSVTAFMPVTAILNSKPITTPEGAVESAQVAALIRNNEFDKALALATEMTRSDPVNSAGYSLQGTAYLGKRDWANARKSFEKALSVRPDDAIALVNLAQIDIQQKDTAAARKRFQSVLAKDRTNVAAMLGMAELEFLGKDAKAALGWLLKAKAARPEAIDPRLSIAGYHMRRGNFSEAINELTEATLANPRNADLLNLLGQAQMAVGRSDAARVTFTQLVAARPEAPLAHYRLATAQIGSNDVGGAADSLTKALRLKPDFVDAMITLAGLETKSKRYAEALTLAKQVQVLQPGSPGGLVVEGDVLAAQERYAEAAKAYEKALAAGQSGSIAIKLHAAQARAGNAKEADRVLQRWLKDHPDDIGSLHYAAADAMRRGESRSGIQYYQLVLRNDPKNVLALNNLASLYQQDGDPRALATAEAAYKLDPESPVVADTLGWILIAQGNGTRGLKLLESASAKEPANLEIRYHLAAGRAKTGDKIGARKELESVLRSGQAFPQREAAQALLKQLL